MFMQFSSKDGERIKASGRVAIKRPNPVYLHREQIEFEVITNEGGPLKGKPGDYLAYDEISGHVWPVSADYVAKHYDFADEKQTDEKPLEFKDITDEQYRVYVFPGGAFIKIDEPVKLNVSESGGHRVLSKDGISHYVPKGWIHLYWAVHEGRPNFAF